MGWAAFSGRARHWEGGGLAKKIVDDCWPGGAGDCWERGDEAEGRVTVVHGHKGRVELSDVTLGTHRTGVVCGIALTKQLLRVTPDASAFSLRSTLLSNRLHCDTYHGVPRPRCVDYSRDRPTSPELYCVHVLSNSMFHPDVPPAPPLVWLFFLSRVDPGGRMGWLGVQRNR